MTPLGSNGYRVEPESLDDSDGILAILPDDRIVLLVGHTRLRIGQGHGCGNSCVQSDWEWNSEQSAPEGLYKLIVGLPEAIKRRAGLVAEKSRASWLKRTGTLGFQLMTDFDLAREVINNGVDSLLDQV